MNRKSVIIVGAGLAGSVIANDLVGDFDVTVVEPIRKARSADDPSPFKLVDVGMPGITTPLFASGLGGTTQFWQNGLITIPKGSFADWPFHFSELEPYIDEVYPLLGKVERTAVDASSRSLEKAYCQLGVDPALIGQPLFYPKKRRNTWNSLKLGRRAKVVFGVVNKVNIDDRGSAVGVSIKDEYGKIYDLSAEIVVLSAGGIGTPIILQNTSRFLGNKVGLEAGFNYEDHPYAFVASFKAPVALSKLWNYRTEGGFIRLPLVGDAEGYPIAFFLRPSMKIHGVRDVVTSALSDLRNKPFDISTYLKLFANRDDILDVLSLKLGINVPTESYSLLMVASQPPSDHKAIWSCSSTGKIHRDWQLSWKFKCSLDKAVKDVLKSIAIFASEVVIHDGWENRLQSSLHHSGTARMGKKKDFAVCDENNKVFDINNLFVCDGSVIPSSAYCNTGLTIAALSRRLTTHFKELHL